VFAQALSGYATALAKAHYTPGSGKAPTAAQLALITQAAKSFSGPKMAQATAHIQTWAKTHCPGSNFGG
jgi:hypothetical protein